MKDGLDTGPGFFPDEDDRILADAARRAFAESEDPEAAIDGMGILGVVGETLPLGAACIVVTEAARAGLDYPLPEALCHAAALGRAGRADAMRAAFARRGPSGRARGPAGLPLLLIEPGGTRVLPACGAPRDRADPLALPEETEVEGEGTRGPDLRALAWTTLAAAILGAGEAMLEAALSHLRTRTQFGRPLGSISALRHRAADDWVRLEDIRAATDRAAVAFDADGARAALPHARIAKALASEYGPIVAENAIHAHGAMGFTWEVGLHRPLALIRQRAATLGTARQLMAEIGETYLEEPR